ncbi:hypothetical protein BD410DRAFT_539603 [Rickenella mellea]|uniref:Uncharacterized protein n=1 Tax=Rickenella mellea TaxID=50990 RepID=A0A4Y7PQL9_9AGAM|nr:hypothetical protein BD410DRAFT_539603 [Rickenella mellea]
MTSSRRNGKAWCLVSATTMCISLRLSIVASIAAICCTSLLCTSRRNAVLTLFFMLYRTMHHRKHGLSRYHISDVLNRSPLRKT